MSVQEVRSSISEILATFHDETDSRIMIMAHRAGYLSANGDHLPENSLPALERALDQGMDIIEIDFRLTSDGHLVAMHDGTLDRTTNGSGPVSAKTLAEVQELRLRMPDRTLTDEYPPSLAEVVQILKGRAMLVLDKVIITNEAQMNAAMGVLRDADAVDHALFHGSHTAVQVMTILASFPEEINYAPTIRNSTAESTIAMLEALHPPAVELIFNDDQTPMLNPEVIETAKKTGTRIWINSLWASLCGGRHDARALAGEEDETWGWIANRGALIIQSDYPYTLQQYLELRSGNFFEITHDFTPPSLDGWTRIAPNGAVGEIAFHSTNHTFGNRIYWGTPEDTAGGVIVTDVTGAADYRSGAHPSAILRSPAFTLDGVVAHSPLTNDFQVEHISFRLLGGMGAQMGPSNAADVPVASVNQPQGNFLGWLGVALRRDSDGEYLIWGRRSANGQSNSGAGWQMIQWDKSILSAAIADDPPGTLYTLDLIDAAHGDWGWIALGEVQFRLAESQYTWLGFDTDSHGWVDTGDWLGLLYVRNAPWIYNLNLSRWIHLQQAGVTSSGGWVFLPGSTVSVVPDEPTVLNVLNSGASTYVIDDQSNPTLTFVRGRTYDLNISAPGHPFWIKTSPVTGTGSAYHSGVTNNGASSGVISFTVPSDAPDTLYYICQFHSAMQGTINIID
jgi:glycerophosphoryl diester phosphodiesterase